MAYKIGATRDPEPFSQYSKPGESKLFQYQTPEHYNFFVEKTPKFINAMQQEYRARGNNIITFIIPNHSNWDWTDSMLTFNVRLTGTPGTYIRVHQGIWNVIARVRHTANNKKVEEMYDFNKIHNFKWVFEGDTETEASIGTDFLGIGTQATRNGWGAAAAGTVFGCPTGLGFMNAGIFPAKYLKEEHRIEFYINDPTYCLETDYTGLDIIISDIQWHAHVVTDAPTGRNAFGKAQDSLGFEAYLQRYVESGQFRVAYDSYETHQNPLLGVNQDLVISHRAEAVKEIASFVINQTNLANPLINDRLMTWEKLTMTSYQYRMNGAYIPEVPVDCTADAKEAYWYYVRWVNSWKSAGFKPDVVDNPNVTLNDFNNGHFIVLLNVRPSTDENHFVGTVSTVDHNTDPQLNIKFSVPPAAGYIAEHFIRFTTIAQVEAGTTKICIYE